MGQLTRGNGNTFLLDYQEILKPWGRTDSPKNFHVRGNGAVGEIVFKNLTKDNKLLVKYLFVKTNLSVQVHPRPILRGGLKKNLNKDECWLIIDASPGAQVALGLKGAYSKARLRHAALDGSITNLLDWCDVEKGDMFYIPGGTIHSIRGELTLIEIQENVDITYRLFDFNRDRLLDLEEGLAVANLKKSPESLHRLLKMESECQLLTDKAFDLWLSSNWPKEIQRDQWTKIIPIVGHARIDGIQAKPGDCIATRTATEIVGCSKFKAVFAQ